VGKVGEAVLSATALVEGSGIGVVELRRGGAFVPTAICEVSQP